MAAAAAVRAAAIAAAALGARRCRLRRAGKCRARTAAHRHGARGLRHGCPHHCRSRRAGGAAVRGRTGEHASASAVQAALGWARSSSSAARGRPRAHSSVAAACTAVGPIRYARRARCSSSLRVGRAAAGGPRRLPSWRANTSGARRRQRKSSASVKMAAVVRARNWAVTPRPPRASAAHTAPAHRRGCRGAAGASQEKPGGAGRSAGVPACAQARGAGGFPAPRASAVAEQAGRVPSGH